MKSIEISGRYPLCGELKIQGSKNAALPILAAGVLNRGYTVLHHCPRITDVDAMLGILQSLGAHFHWEGSTLILNTAGMQEEKVSMAYAGRMRSSIVLLGSLLGRFSKAWLPYPGGCVIGKRPIDLHLKALEALGAEISMEEEYIKGTAKKLKGTDIFFRFPSVGATENSILAAAGAEGITRIFYGAKEPEIVSLCNVLRGMGASIEGDGTDCICIRGRKMLHDVEYELEADRIVAGTYVLAAVAGGGSITLNNMPLGQLDAFLEKLKTMGISICQQENLLYADGKNGVKALEHLVTGPYPGFPTDLQSQMMAVLSIAEGESCIEENIFEDRFKVVDKLNLMGAHIRVEQNCARIHGQKCLHGAEVYADELRGGAALVIAGLLAEGKTTVKNCHFIERGYENIVRDLRVLGARIQEGETCETTKKEKREDGGAFH